MTPKNRIFASMKRWLPTVAATLAICYLTLTPDPLPDTDVDWPLGIDKWVHAAMYGGWALIVALDLRRSGKALTNRALMTIAAAAITFGGVIELLQAYVVPGRSGDFDDFAADAIGAFIAALTARPAARLLKPGARKRQS